MPDNPTIYQILLDPSQAADTAATEAVISRELGSKLNSDWSYHIIGRSIDARRKDVKVVLRVELRPKSVQPVKAVNFLSTYQNVEDAPTAIIVGAGPAGLFAALKLLEIGIKPIVIERGKDVRSRRRDIAELSKNHLVNPESNYCFGEGGAGTFSDGKLYTRSKKRGDVKKVLQILVEHGADPEILINAHPHIGTNKLPAIISSVRETITSHGGEVRFNSRLTDLILDGNKISGCMLNGSEKLYSDHLILASGHSARDIFELLNQRGIEIQAKAFALGVRVEHPQKLIDQIQYHCESRGEYLPAASYSLTSQVNGRGVYSFCMCPGGVIAPCATNQEEIVTNGWSPSKRDQPYANSGVVVELKLTDFKSESPLAGVEFQAEIERKAWIAGGKSQRAPAQRMIDFVEHKLSTDLPKTSYQPGVHSVNLHDVLPEFICKALIGAFQEFGKKMRGYYTNEAVIHAPESRTSSPVRIPRDPESLEHVQVSGLYPCGEGAGYAGGIVSAAIDGDHCAFKIGLKMGLASNE